MALNVLQKLENSCSTVNEIEAWIGLKNNASELSDALLDGDLDNSDMKWQVYAALERSGGLGSHEMLHDDVVGQLLASDDKMTDAYQAVRADVRTVFNDVTGLQGGGVGNEGETIIEFRCNGEIDSIDNYWIAAKNGSIWTVQFEGYDYTFSLIHDPDQETARQ